MLRNARIHTVVLPVADLDASRAWSIACGLGAEVLHDATERLLVLEIGGETHIAFVETDIWVTPRAPDCAYVVLAVPDAAVAREQLQACGIAVGPLTARGRTRVFEFTDPDGHRFEVSDLMPQRPARQVR